MYAAVRGGEEGRETQTPIQLFEKRWRLVREVCWRVAENEGAEGDGEMRDGEKTGRREGRRRGTRR